MENADKTEATHTQPEDLIDRLRAEWACEQPAFDTEAMAIVGRLIHLGNVMKTSASKALKSHGLLYTDFDILATLRRAGKPYALTPTKLMASVLLTSGAMTAALKRLEEKGLIDRPASEGDGRVRMVRLTDSSHKLVEEAAQSRFREADNWTKNLGISEKNQLETLLRALCAHGNKKT
ncbi:MarR family winged helix-turn-helix transcriptional regulator [Kordiimonas sp.]|uniref:MarR family winged helix-turn-helix transcriptional regulator n=1 Tax=Kordiimonas sp. TaxID=1970157 RepID=UPI003A95BDCA